MLPWLVLHLQKLAVKVRLHLVRPVIEQYSYLGLEHTGDRSTHQGSESLHQVLLEVSVRK